MRIQEIIEVALAANAAQFALQKLGVIDFYERCRPAKFPDWCSFCFFFWCGFIYSYHDFKSPGIDWAFFYGLVIAEIARWINILYFKLLQ